jgi:hypothetical protein
VVTQGAPVPADREAAAKTAESIAREPPDVQCTW